MELLLRHFPSLIDNIQAGKIPGLDQKKVLHSNVHYGLIVRVTVSA